MILNNDVSDILSNSEAEKLGFRKNVMSDFAMQKALCREIRQKAKGCYISHPFADNCKLKSPGIHQAISILYFHCFFLGALFLFPSRSNSLAPNCPSTPWRHLIRARAAGYRASYPTASTFSLVFWSNTETLLPAPLSLISWSFE